MYAMEQAAGADGFHSYWNPLTWFKTPRDATIEVLVRRRESKEPIIPGHILTQAEWSDLYTEIRRLWADEWGKDTEDLTPRVVIEALRDYRITATGSPVADASGVQARIAQLEAQRDAATTDAERQAIDEMLAQYRPKADDTMATAIKYGAILIGGMLVISALGFLTLKRQ